MIKERSLMKPNKSILVPIVFLICLVLTGCASIPKEAVSLNQEVGKGIADNQNAYLNLLNAYFSQKSAEIDRWIQNEYLPAYISNIRAEMKKHGVEDKPFDEHMTKDMLTDIVKKRNDMQRDLEKARLSLWERITKDHVVLLQANASITGLLQSAVDVKEATSALGNKILKASGTDFTFSDFEKVFDEYLKKAGDASATGVSIYEGVKPLKEKER